MVDGPSDRVFYKLDRSWKVVLRMICSIASNFMLPLLMLVSLPLFLSQSESKFDFLLNAVATQFLIELDDKDDPHTYVDVGKRKREREEKERKEKAAAEAEARANEKIEAAKRETDEKLRQQEEAHLRNLEDMKRQQAETNADDLDDALDELQRMHEEEMAKMKEELNKTTALQEEKLKAALTAQAKAAGEVADTKDLTLKDFEEANKAIQDLTNIIRQIIPPDFPREKMQEFERLAHIPLFRRVRVSNQEGQPADLVAASTSPTSYRDPENICFSPEKSVTGCALS